MTGPPRLADEGEMVHHRTEKVEVQVQHGPTLPLGKHGELQNIRQYTFFEVMFTRYVNVQMETSLIQHINLK